MYTERNGETTPRFDSEEAVRLWRHLFGGERGLLHIFTGARAPDGKLDNLRNTNYNYPAKAEDAARWALAKSKEGREVYFCAHLLHGPERRKENAVAVRALWGELDGAPLPNSDLKPTAVVESSTGRYHVYWQLTDELPPESAEALNKRLAREIGADPAGFDLTQLLRVPGTVNYKYADNPLVRLVEVREAAYVPGELDARLPQVEEPAPVPELVGDEPPVRLNPAALKRWRGEVVERKEDGELDRSESLVQIARALSWAGATGQTVRDALRERDVALGWRKYADRSDGGESAYTKLAQDVCMKVEAAKAEEYAEEERYAAPSQAAAHNDPQRNSVTTPNKGDYAITLTRLRDVPLPGPMRYLVADLIPGGFPSMIYGDGGVAKSMLTMSLATAIAGGSETWMNHEIQNGPVVYADFELDEGEQRRRAARLARGAFMDDIPADLYYESAVGESSERFLRALLKACVDGGVVMVVLDSLGLALEGDPQSPTDVIRFHKRCLDPFRAKGITVVIIDHQAKTLTGERYQAKRAFGTVYKENLARSILQVEPRERGKGMLRVKVRHTKTNFGSAVAPFGIEWRFSEEKVEVQRFALEAGELVAERTLNLRDKMLLSLISGSAFLTEVAENTGSNYQSVKNEASRLRREGLVEDTGATQGQARQVRLTDSGKRAASAIASRTYIGGDQAIKLGETEATAGPDADDLKEVF